MEELDLNTLKALISEGIAPQRLAPRSLQGAPANTAGIADLRAYVAPELRGTGTRGFVTADPRLKAFPQNRAAPGAVFLRPDADADTIAHEAEHVMAKKQLGHPAEINTKFDELIGDPKARGQFVLAAIDAAPYLKEKYGIDNAYFSPNILKRNAAPVALYEQLASLAAAEYTLNVDLTKDPVLRKTLFKDPAVRETYNALTGLRQTRLDPRDLAPYTRVSEAQQKTDSLLEKARKSLRFAQGGDVKLI